MVSSAFFITTVEYTALRSEGQDAWAEPVYISPEWRSVEFKAIYTIAEAAFFKILFCCKKCANVIILKVPYIKTLDKI